MNPKHRDELRARLHEAVAERFERLSGFSVRLWLVEQVIDSSVDERGPIDWRDTPPSPMCEGCSDLQKCIRQWLARLGGLPCRPEPQPHDCPLGHHCSVVPVTWRDKAVAACKLVCPGDLTAEAFEHHLELLEVLIETFQARHGDLLALVAEGAPTRDRSTAEADLPRPGQPRSVTHPQVHNAMGYIEAHLSDSRMSVAGIAADLKINSTYLSHLFAEQVGIRMGRYIAQRRIELAKKLLATRNWQIKRVAYESGHKNADWFSQVFHAYVGLTPGEYRRSVR